MRFPVWLLLLPSTAFGVAVGPLPAPEYADTEVTTNVPFAVSLETMSRIEFTLTFDASPTNAVEVSVGTDENGDGRLSTSEAAWTFGYDCGHWLTRNADESRETDEPAPETDRITRTFALVHRSVRCELHADCCRRSAEFNWNRHGLFWTQRYGHMDKSHGCKRSWNLALNTLAGSGKLFKSRPLGVNIPRACMSLMETD